MKTTLITGTSRGIGKALAEILLEKGYKVIGTSTTGESTITHPNLTNLKLDISKPEEITNITQNLKSSPLKEAKLDLLINNAGVLLEEWDNPEIDMDQLRKTFEINVFGLINFCEKLIPHINQSSTIVNLGSTWGAFSEENKDEFQPHYKISKAAVHMYTKILAARLKPQSIKVLCLDPG